MNKKVLFFFNSLKPSGGIERVIATLAEKLASSNQITILVKDEPVSFYKLPPNVRLKSLGHNLRFNMNNRFSRILAAGFSVILNYKSLKRFLKQEQFDYYYLAHPLNVLEFSLAYGIDKTKVIVTEHGAQSAYNTVYRLLKKWLYPSAKTYVVPTIKETDSYRSLGFPAIYIPHFRSNLDYVESTRSKKVVLNIGRYTEVKQQMVLLKLWKDLVESNSIDDWELHIVGQGELKVEFERFILKNRLQQFIKLLPPIDNVAEYYKSSSIFALSSKSEGFGMVLLEAISFGLPCVTFDCPSGPRDIIADRRNGFLVPLNDQQRFKQSLLNLVEDKELRDKMGNSAYLMSLKWEDEKIMKKWELILS